ncbi:hypothetical protein QNH28_23520 [Paenibacillus sp. G2S3]|uniref:hypothetical protein n=1 Tax=Paenibacillus sp. G2S3 TaxID=3047872 RepID=UPI0024C153E1|nr:hypothetical protein [Paenibacillus sp. G2S3]WHY18411.1 hypothetical protein QNH28_23520 [Paenibacillus sp. G2S3]
MDIKNSKPPDVGACCFGVLMDTEDGITPQLLVQMVVNITVRDFTFVLITISPYNN